MDCNSQDSNQVTDTSQLHAYSYTTSAIATVVSRVNNASITVCKCTCMHGITMIVANAI